MRHTRKALHFWPLVMTVFLTDCATKAAVERHIATPHVPHPVLGEFLQFTLAYNRGAAMSLNLGTHSRPLLIATGVLALLALWIWYRRLHPEATGPLTALGLVWAGAAGNLWDRLRSGRGVVDFIDLGIGDWRFFTFNIGDVAITVGAIWLAVILSRPEAVERDGMGNGGTATP